MQFPTAQRPSQLSEPQSSQETAPRNKGGQAFARGAGLAVYIHWPFCQSKCPYCDFNSYARRSLSEEQYLAAAIEELRHYHEETTDRSVSSVFFGGGTPSLMAPEAVAALLDEIAALWPLSPDCEITLEANPSSAEASKFKGYRLAGVNRVSIGVQSLSDEQLRFLGRLHNAEDARAALAIADETFDRMSFDLIYARPEQSEAEWRAELNEALALARGHVSLYQLTIEPETAFFALHDAGKLRMPDVDLSADLYSVTQEICEAAGLPAYEVSNHAAPGQESRHNLAYWRCDDYLGIGPGAHGRITVAGKRYAMASIETPSDWAAKVKEWGHGAEERLELDERQQAEEAVLMGLRLREGIDLRRLAKATGFKPAPTDICVLEAEGLLRREGDWLSATHSGMLVLNAVIETIASGLSEAPAAQYCATAAPNEDGAGSIG
jgi:putative oxygen-independent coproporphyrinogen III oxidase